MTRSLAAELKAAEKKFTKRQQEKEKAQQDHAKARHEFSELKRKADTHRKVVAGAIVLANAEHDAGYKTHLVRLLETHLKPADRVYFEDLGIKPAKKKTSPATEAEPENPAPIDDGLTPPPLPQ